MILTWREQAGHWLATLPNKLPRSDIAVNYPNAVQLKPSGETQAAGTNPEFRATGRSRFERSVAQTLGRTDVFKVDESPLRDVSPRKELLLFRNAIRVADPDVIVELVELAEILPADGTGGFREFKRQLLWGCSVGHGWTSPGAHSDHRCAPNIHILVRPKLLPANFKIPMLWITFIDRSPQSLRKIPLPRLRASFPPFPQLRVFFCACIADFDSAKESGR